MCCELGCCVLCVGVLHVVCSRVVSWVFLYPSLTEFSFRAEASFEDLLVSCVLCFTNCDRVLVSCVLCAKNSVLVCLVCSVMKVSRVLRVINSVLCVVRISLCDEKYQFIIEVMLEDVFEVRCFFLPRQKPTF